MLRRNICLTVLALMCSSLFAVAGIKQEDSVKQNIVVEKVEGISDDFMRGVDISSLYDVESHGGKFIDANGNKTDIFKILKDSGVNWIRLRVWNNPTYESDVKDANGKRIAKKGEKYGGGNNSVEVDLPLAKRAKDAGFKLLVDFHYSDTWADPGKQNMPQDWKNLSEAQLNEAVQKFTTESINKFVDFGATPDAIQIGNELNNGFMWPIGKIWAYPDPAEKVGGMNAFVKLMQSASKGVRESKNGESMKIIVHLADGGKNDLYRSIFDPLTKANLDFDIIGLSFYTYWHGSTDELKANLEDLSTRYKKQMAVVETAYAFTDEDGDNQGNVFLTYSDDSHGYVPSVQGQATAIRDIFATVASVNGGCGVFYWEPSWLPVKGAGLSSTQGNTWENQGMFDYKGRVLPSLNVFGLVGGKNSVTNTWGGSAKNSDSAFVPYKIADEIKITAKPSEIPNLPSKVKVVLSNDSEKLVSVNWENIDWKNQGEGEIKVKGNIENASFNPIASVTLSSKTNLIEDSSFESGKFGKWKLNGSGTACYFENNKGNAHDGKFTYKYWLGTGFKSILSQEIQVSNGTYELSVWSMGGGGEKNIRLFAANFDKSDSKKQITSKITNVGWNEWKQYKIKVPVSNGKITVGIYLDTNPDCWGNFDEIELVKID